MAVPWSCMDQSRIAHLLDRLNADSVAIKPAVFHPISFVRMLAKIGHSYAVAIYGMDGFRPLALDLILGRDRRANYLVGGGADAFPHENCGYWLGHTLLPSGLIQIKIQLFPSLKTPVYQVVVGTARV